MTENKTPANKLRKIRDLCNQFKQHIKHKPLDTKIDEARLQGFINDILNVLMHEKYSEVNLIKEAIGTKEHWDEVNRLEKEAASPEVYRQQGLTALKEIKEQRNYGSTTDS